jgi:hypothetical protein
MSYIESIQDAIWQTHRCASAHVESVKLEEKIREKVVFSGTVEVFNLIDHPKSQRCYAWSSKDASGEESFVAVLEIPPVTNPRTAVLASIVAKMQKK